MAIQITPGPLPADGARIKIEEALTAFVQGTTITNFGAEEFEGEPIDFVISQTDAPSTDSRTRGTLWFARGEGKLYKWTPEPVDSGNYFPSEPGTNQSEFQWMAMSDRREQMVRCRWGWGQYERLRPNTTASEWAMTEDVSQERWSLIMCATAQTDGPVNTGNGDYGWVPTTMDETFHLTHAEFIGPAMISTDTNTDGQYAVVVDCGFATALVNGSGCNGPGGRVQLGFHFSDGDPHSVLSISDTSAMTNTSVVIAQVAESFASVTAEAKLVFMLAGESNMSKTSGTDRF